MDLAKIERTYRAGWLEAGGLCTGHAGGAAAVWYGLGARSRRRIERLCQRDVAFRVITANQGPDHTTIARFRRTHEQAVASLFTDVLRLCAEAGLVPGGVGGAGRDQDQDRRCPGRQSNRRDHPEGSGHDAGGSPARR
jgi:hypothetical protein